MSGTCLVMIDLQNGFMNSHTAHLPEKLAGFLRTHHFDSVIATRYCNTPDTACSRLSAWKDCMQGTPDAELVPEVQPFVQRIFDKHRFSGYTPALQRFVESAAFDTVYFCGVNTDCCVLATVFACFDTVQDCAVISDLCASTLGTEKHAHALTLLADNITPQRVILSSALH